MGVDYTVYVGPFVKVSRTAHNAGPSISGMPGRMNDDLHCMAEQMTTPEVDYVCWMPNKGGGVSFCRGGHFPHGEAHVTNPQVERKAFCEKYESAIGSLIMAYGGIHNVSVEWGVIPYCS